ncbi:MAG: glycerol-3-phosphate dehydrogenase [Alphaproteobacteria bacterium]|nr:MAG: glycerol-3-phosphate dehydrogenase [Alphaproteobacteria bacterium]
MAQGPPAYDLAIIGGGVNGCGIARDAAGRGASVVLLEQADLASGTSSASTKLIHGGLRYLEQYEFRLVREALRERDVLWRLAPHIIWPMRFVLPHHRALRPRWFLRIGLFLYDHLGGSLLPGSRGLDLTADAAGVPLKPTFRHAFEYSDCWVEDARLVVLNARDAADRGAEIRTRARVVDATRGADHWRLTVESARHGRQQVAARTLVNAAGPWAGSVHRQMTYSRTPAPVRLVQGSHIVVPRLFEHERCYIFQNADARIVFAIPFERDFTLIGTTDRDYEGDPAAVAASPEEIAYLCAAVSEYFCKTITPADVVLSYSGVRPLYDDGASKAQEATRDYVLHLDAPAGEAPLLSVFGGKITTYRRLAELALGQLKGFLPAAERPAWTGTAPLPGGDFPHNGYDELVAETQRAHPYLAPAHAARLVRAYGTRAARLLDGIRAAADLGQVFGHDLTEREVTYLMTQEWAETADDVLWRRSKLALRFTPAQKSALDQFMRDGAQRAASSAA